MAAIVHKTSQADADFTAAILRLFERNPAAANRFIDDLERLTVRLSEFPEIFPLQRRSTRPEWRNVRMAVLRRFHYLVFYTYDQNIVTIRRIIRGARDEP